jgi:hypothetical protein
MVGTLTGPDTLLGGTLLRNTSRAGFLDGQVRPSFLPGTWLGLTHAWVGSNTHLGRRTPARGLLHLTEQGS